MYTGNIFMAFDNVCNDNNKDLVLTAIDKQLPRAKIKQEICFTKQRL